MIKNKNDKLMITKLLCEYNDEPICIDTQNPIFSWIVSSKVRNNYQTAYQIIVSKDSENIQKDIGDMWDTGKVQSTTTVNIEYKGQQLESCTRYYWKVRIWDSEGNITSYSKTGVFETVFLNGDEIKAEWLVAPKFPMGVSSPMFRKEFKISSKVIRARAYVSGLGYYELRINGKKVGKNLLDPGWTDYKKRILYSTYKVDEYLKDGLNAIGVILGNGWFVSPYGESRGRKPQFIFDIKIEYENGKSESVTSSTDSGWFVSDSPIIFNSIYNGEIYDARLEKEGWDTAEYKIKDNDWRRPLLGEGHNAKLVSQNIEPIKQLEEIKPIKITNPEPGIFVYDIGQNIAGWVRLKVRGKRGTKVSLKFAEMLYENGTINQENLREAKSEDIYILKGNGLEEYEPRFTYHGFRYVQVEGFPGKPGLDNITGKLVASSVERVGKFQCSNELVNKIYNNIIWTLIDNRHSVPTDCPQRNERMGWLNDATTRVEGEIYNFNMVNFYKKWLNDIIDAQGERSGSITDTAPYVGGSRPADPVCSCFVLIPWLLYIHYGDEKVLKDLYISMKRWIDYLLKQSVDNILYYSYYGDWAPPLKYGTKDSIGDGAVSRKTPGELISTGYLYYNAMLFTKIARALHNFEDEEKYKEISKKIKDCFNKKFLNSKTGNYSTGNQACNIFPLFLGIVPDQIKEKLIYNIINDIEENNYHLTTGNQCTKYLIETLTDIGYIDIVYKIVTQKTYPSWGYMISKGATTIWERWEYEIGDGMNSHNHPMQGSISPWFYRGLAGIDFELDKDEQRFFIIKPNLIDSLKFVKASIETVFGKVVSEWKILPNEVLFKIGIPFGIKAKIYLPKFIRNFSNFLIKEGNNIIWEDGKLKNNVIGITNFCEKLNWIVLTTGSGEYIFHFVGL